MEQWSIEDFKIYVRKQIDKYYWVTPSIVVLRSFYIGDVKRPKDITVRMFDWLRSIAEYEMKVYKSTIKH